MGRWRGRFIYYFSLFVAQFAPALVRQLFGMALLAVLPFQVSIAISSQAVTGEPVLAANGLRVCSIDLTRQRLDGFYTNQSGERFGSIERLVTWLSVQHRQLECAVNGAIFTTNFAPLGLFVADGVLVQPLNTELNQPGNFFLQPNGALIVRSGGAHIRSTADLVQQPLQYFGDVELAVQSGPLLLQGGIVSPRLDPNSDSRFTRNAVCTIDAQHVLLAYADRPLTLYGFADALLSVGCTDALYLDGHLSQMYPFNLDLSPAQRQPLSTFIGITSRTEP